MVQAIVLGAIMSYAHYEYTADRFENASESIERVVSASATKDGSVLLKIVVNACTRRGTDVATVVVSGATPGFFPSGSYVQTAAILQGGQYVPKLRRLKNIDLVKYACSQRVTQKIR